MDCYLKKLNIGLFIYASVWYKIITVGTRGHLKITNVVIVFGVAMKNKRGLQTIAPFLFSPTADE